MKGLSCKIFFISSTTELATCLGDGGAFWDTFTHALDMSSRLRNLESYSTFLDELDTRQHSVGIDEGGVGQEDSTAVLSLCTTWNLSLNLFETLAARLGISWLPSTTVSVNFNLSKCSWIRDNQDLQEEIDKRRDKLGFVKEANNWRDDSFHVTGVLSVELVRLKWDWDGGLERVWRWKLFIIYL